MKSSPTRPSLPLAILLATAAICPLVSGQTIPAVPAEIVSAWKANGGDALLIFRYDGVYFQVQDDASRPGMERGTFTWNKATSAFTATTLRDTNGESGLSHPAGATTLFVSGNTLTYNVVGEGSFTFSRVVNTASAIVGSWFFPGDPSTVTFLADGTYYSTEEENDAPFSYDGMERGTYTWNSSTKILTANATTDTNGDTGLSNLPAGFTATIVGNTMTVPDDVGTSVLRRITQITTPLNAAPDFEVDKFSNYRQTSTNNPALLPFPLPPEGGDLPFWGEAYIDGTVSGTGGSLTITGQAARPFINDGGWSIANEYSSLALLNASTAFPNGATYTFARSGGTATLTYPAGGTFPPAPNIQPIDDDDGAWSGGEYLLGQTQTLIWNPHTAYNPATLVTVLSVVDQATSAEILYETVIQGDITSYDFSGRLTPGRAYDVQLEHIKIASSTTAGTGPFVGKLGYALYNSNTRFTMVASDEVTFPPVITEHPVDRSTPLGSNAILSVTVRDDPGTTFQWFKNNIPISGQTGNSIALFGINAAAYGNYTVSVTNAIASIISNIGALSPPRPYDVYLTTIGLNPLSEGLPHIDYDHDGIPNLMEFLLGGDAKIADPTILPSLTTANTLGGRNLIFRYQRRFAAAGAGETIETSATLSPPWKKAVAGESGVSFAFTPMDLVTEQVVVTIPVSGPKHFARLAVPGAAAVINTETSYKNLKNSGNQPQLLPSQVGPGTGTEARGYGDFFGDGSQALFTARLRYVGEPYSSNNTVSEFAFWRHQSDGSYIKDNSILTGASGCIHPRKALVADFNNDGRPDIFILCHGWDGYPFPGERNRIVLSQPSGNYSIADAAPNVGFFHGGTAADLDQDGDIDVITVRGSATQCVFLNDGNGSFKREQLNRLPNSISYVNHFSAELLDINEDGKPDLIVGGHEWEGAVTQVYLNPGDFNFHDVVPVNIPPVAGEGVVLDFTATGTGPQRTLWVLRTSGGDGTFYQGRTIQKVLWPSMQFTIPLQQRSADWIPWLIPVQSGGQSGVGADDLNYDVFVPQ